MGGKKFRTNLSLRKVRQLKSTSINDDPSKWKYTVLNHAALVWLAETAEARREARLKSKCKFGKIKKKGLYLLLSRIGKTPEERARLQNLQEVESDTQFTDWNIENDLDGFLHGADVFPSSHGGEEIDKLGQAIMGDLWKL